MLMLITMTKTTTTMRTSLPRRAAWMVALVALALLVALSSGRPCAPGVEFPLHDAWHSHVSIDAYLYGANGDEKNNWLAVATEYSSFKTRQHAIVSDASLHYTDIQYCLGMGAATYSSSNTLPAWNTTYAKVIYNISACVYTDYEFANQNSGFAWLACNIRLFGFESNLCSRATAQLPITPTCVMDSTGERWEWSWNFQPTGESETHSFWVDYTNGYYLKYQWSGKSADGCVFNESMTFDDFSPTLDDSWFHEPSFGMGACSALDFPSVSFCSLDDPHCSGPN